MNPLSSLLKRSPYSSSSLRSEGKGLYKDDESIVEPTVVREEPLPVPSLKVKRVDKYFSTWGSWKYRDTNAKVITVEPPPSIPGGGGSNDIWKDFSFVLVQIRSEDATADIKLTDKDLLLTPTVVFGLSLRHSTTLVLPNDRKQLLQSLVEAHHQQVGFDDFIKGKGHGLVVNFFGPSDVGKTLSAEATSEHVRSPLYVVGGGDLGTTTASLDAALERIFDVVTAWKAIVLTLIHEADVFLEKRSLHELNRNAMAYVFLRHVEYYRGILFLTTNRVKSFDEAFLTGIHVPLHSSELTQESKEQVWVSFITKMGSSANGITKEEITELAKRRVNGRQIKNAGRTAHCLALGKGERVGYEHLRLTVDAIDEFTRKFVEKRE
ncbi:hypothetical protein M413DRAFT_7761 [Hebeloma cylindrosporum]|uniref:ATPase AAA-type core domain-containing protein n=1 Tax=Hebeloma cylindrosporum TaxID=76867 RepID=A0A0C2YBI9_HEBCY|nr:hypothetical protein M413DRAFT_7761 [Hebeloma cylindrosporum h7]